MLTNVLRHLFWTTLCFLAFAHAHAQQLQVIVLSQNTIERMIEAPIKIHLKGSIDKDAAPRLARVLKLYEEQSISVHLDSPGGNLLAALEIGRLLRSVSASTHVDAKAMCYSACAFAYIGGSSRYMDRDARYGVHRASTMVDSFDTMESGQIVAALVGAYIREMGVSPALLDLSVKASANDIYLLSRKQLEDLRVVNNGSSKPSWTIEVADGGTFLLGEQSHYHGTGKFRLICGRKGQVLISSYTAGEKADFIAQGWDHSLLISNRPVPLARPLEIENRNGLILAMFEVTDTQLKAMLNAESVGHAMQLDRSAPTFVGYRVDIDAEAHERFNTYVRNCLK
ncbi:ATP-dependent Clp protease proteolytic subunit [Aquabacterium sp.]|uniref:ATP-dependent Clp protease proteolytic subunit n=1 Tax=Aquabacterium sp. TaxID=1872578 RepID=UPI003B707700